MQVVRNDIQKNYEVKIIWNNTAIMRKSGKITLEKKAVQNSENTGKSIYLMSLDEFLSHPRKLVRKNNFIHSMTPIQYCKIEKYRECVQGTMRVPKGK